MPSPVWLSRYNHLSLRLLALQAVMTRRNIYRTGEKEALLLEIVCLADIVVAAT
jgi:hypothetical protein